MHWKKQNFFFKLYLEFLLLWIGMVHRLILSWYWTEISLNLWKNSGRLNIFTIIYFCLFLNVHLFSRESVSGGEAERQEDRGSQAGSRLSEQSPTRGWNLSSGTLKSWPELKLDAYPTEPPRHPLFLSFLKHGLSFHLFPFSLSPSVAFLFFF